MHSKPEFISQIDIQKDENGLIKVNGRHRQQIAKDISIGLTAYESVCSPRKIENINELEFSKEQIDKVIKEVLRCNICYEIFHNPVCIKGCLHKFCKSCISDYIFKVKRECAICRHQIETKRLLKEDNKIKGIIDCFIPDQTKFKEEEEKIINMQIKDCVFKDEYLHKKQMERARKEEDKEQEEMKTNSREHPKQNTNENNYSRQNLLNKKTNRDNSHSQHNNELSSNDIIVYINCDEKDESLQKYFKFTRMKVEDSHTLEFISRFICYKQNFKCDQIKKINFYTFDSNSKKKPWSQNDKISDVVKFDCKIPKKDEMKENFYISLYHLNLFFYTQ